MFLITFGDDWTLGTGAWYKPAMPKIVYENTEVNYDDSWRILVRDYFGCKESHINFAASNSSNQKQFALAKSYFNSKRFLTFGRSSFEVSTFGIIAPLNLPTSLS